MNELRIHVRSIRGSSDPEHAVAVDDWVLSGVGGSELVLARRPGVGVPIRVGLGSGIVDGVRTVMEEVAGALRAGDLADDLDAGYAAGTRRAGMVQDQYGTSAPRLALAAMRTSGEFVMASTGLPIYLADADVLVRIDPILEPGRSSPAIGATRSLRPHQMLVISTEELHDVLGPEWTAGRSMEGAGLLDVLGESLNAVCDRPGCLIAVWPARQ